VPWQHEEGDGRQRGCGGGAAVGDRGENGREDKEAQSSAKEPANLVEAVAASEPSPEATGPGWPASVPRPMKRSRKERSGRAAQPIPTIPTIGRRAAEERTQVPRVVNLLSPGPNPKCLDLEACDEAVRVADEDVIRQVPRTMTLEDDAHRQAVGRLAVRVVGVVGEAVRIDLDDVAELVEGSVNPKGGIDLDDVAELVEGSANPMGGPVFVRELGRRGSDEPGGVDGEAVSALLRAPSSGNSVYLQF